MCSGSWLPLIAPYLLVDEILILSLADIYLRLHHLGVHESLHWLVRCGRQRSPFNWLFRGWLPHDWGAETRLSQFVVLVGVRCLFLTNHSCFLEVAISVALKTKASESSVLN